MRDERHLLPPGLELIRVAILLALTVLAVIAGLPAILDSAAAPFH